MPVGGVIGVGTGSTANYFIAELGKIKHKFDAAVASSEATAQRLKALGIDVVDLNNVVELTVYVDGADEVDRSLAMVKGGGGALTREKIVAAVSRTFVCIADESKLVDVLGRFPLPVEVIPMARSYVARELVKLGGQPGMAPGLRHRQRQLDPRRAQPVHHAAGRARDHAQPDRRRRHQRAVSPAAARTCCC